MIIFGQDYKDLHESSPRITLGLKKLGYVTCEILNSHYKNDTTMGGGWAMDMGAQMHD